VTPPGISGPERIAREKIDVVLDQAGWVVQSRDDMNLTAGRGVAVREFKMARKEDGTQGRPVRVGASRSGRPCVPSTPSLVNSARHDGPECVRPVDVNGHAG
jgi:hypothetical protein